MTTATVFAETPPVQHPWIDALGAAGPRVRAPRSELMAQIETLQEEVTLARARASAAEHRAASAPHDRALFAAFRAARDQAAEAALGKDNLEVYHTYFTPLEWTVPHRGENKCYAKLICDKSKGEQVVGLHICGPNAGEMTQGFAVALKCGATKAHFDSTVGIHPTNVEQFTTLSITKASGTSAESTGC